VAGGPRLIFTTTTTKGEKTMGKYVFAYRGGGGMPETEEEGAALMQAWMSWLESLGESVVDAGNPFGDSVSVTTSGSNGQAGSGLTGYSVVSASSLDEAVSKAGGCPIFASGGGVDVYETLPM
jgi:hypothetical protein